MTKSKFKGHISLYIPSEMGEEMQRLADEEMIPRANWMKRALLNEINRLRKLRMEAVYKPTLPPHKNGPRKTKTITE